MYILLKDLHYSEITFNHLPCVVVLVRITEGSIPQMCISSILLIQSDSKIVYLSGQKSIVVVQPADERHCRWTLCHRGRM